MLPQMLVERVFGLEETRREIVKYFQPADIKTMRLVSRYWCQVLENHPCWQAFQIKLTAENCREILTNESISRKKIGIVLEISTSCETSCDTLSILSEIIAM